MPLKKNILLTGGPGVGKTTIIKKVIPELENAGGFFTEEIREHGKRVGFRIVTLDGEKGILAYKRKGEFMIGSYSVDIKDLEEVAVRSIHLALREKNVIVIDEIGKMEILSQKFRDVVIEALRSAKTVMGVISREDSGFFKKVKEMDNVELIEVRFDNREEVARKLKEFINKKMRRSYD